MDFVGVINQVCNKKSQISVILKKSAIDLRYSISVMKTFLQCGASLKGDKGQNATK